MDAFALTLGVIFVAELGDKSQLLAFALATRLRTSLVVIGVVAANVTTQAAAAFAGDLLGSALDGPVVAVGAAVLFLVFAALALRGDDGHAHDPGEAPQGPAARTGALRGVATVAGAVILAEVGDKTMLATMTLAARDGFVAVWLGASLGMTLAGLLGVAAGRLVGARLPVRVLRYASAAVFAAVGVWIAVDAL